MRYILTALLLILTLSVFSQNPKAFVIPELREWQGNNGTTTISERTTLVIEKNASTDIKQIAQVLSDDYLEMFGTKLRVKTAAATTGDIQLKLSPQLLKDKGNESYKIDIGDKIVLRANTPQGLYWSTRTILQLAEQSKNLPKGAITDYPAYPMRGFLLDAARKYFSMDYLKAVVKMMSYYKMNTFQVHLNDNGFKRFF